jgi:uncharacterized protein YcnI
MRCSGWSSLVISACSALALAAPAGAAVSIDPAQVHTGDFVRVVISVPNMHDDYPFDHVTLGIPTDFKLDDAEAKSGWTQSRTGQAVTWSNGKIPRGQYASFGVRGTAPAKVETVVFNVLVGDKTGRSITYRIDLNVIARGTEDSWARSRSDTALVVAVIAIGLSLAALIAAGYAWFRSPP